MSEMPDSIHPQRLYSSEVVAFYLDLDRESVYRIPERHLPRRHVGPKRGLLRYLGADILRYIGATDEAA